VRSFRLALLARGFSRARSSLALFATFAVVRSRSLEGIPRLRVLQSYCLNAPGRRSVCGTKRNCWGAHGISGAEGRPAVPSTWPRRQRLTPSPSSCQASVECRLQPEVSSTRRSTSTRSAMRSGRMAGRSDGTGREERLRTDPRLQLGDLVPPLQITAADHEAGGWVQIFRVHDGKFVNETDWFRGYPEVVAAAVKKGGIAGSCCGLLLGEASTKERHDDETTEDPAGRRRERSGRARHRLHGCGGAERGNRRTNVRPHRADADQWRGAVPGEP
jgi:hypothetical protein